MYEKLKYHISAAVFNDRDTTVTSRQMLLFNTSDIFHTWYSEYQIKTSNNERTNKNYIPN